MQKYMEIKCHTSEDMSQRRKQKGKSKNTLKQKWKHNITKTVECSKSSSKKEGYSDKCLH